MVATGGIGDGAAVAAVLAAGAVAAQLGTAFLAAHEAGTHPAHRAALASDAETALTRAFTGRRARGIVNRFLADHSADAPSAYPEVHHLTAPLRAAARERGDGDGFNLWAGQAHELAREEAAGRIVATLAADARAAAQAAAERLTPNSPYDPTGVRSLTTGGSSQRSAIPAWKRWKAGSSPSGFLPSCTSAMWTKLTPSGSLSVA